MNSENLIVLLMFFTVAILPLMLAFGFAFYKMFLSKTLNASEIAEALGVPVEYVKVLGPGKFDVSFEDGNLIGWFEDYSTMGSDTSRYRFHLAYKTKTARPWVSMSGDAPTSSNQASVMWDVQAEELNARMPVHGAPRALMGEAQYQRLLSHFYRAHVDIDPTGVEFAWKGSKSPRLKPMHLRMMRNARSWSRDYLRASPQNSTEASLAVIDSVADPRVIGRMLTRLTTQSPNHPGVRRHLVQQLTHGMPEVVVSLIHHASPQALGVMDSTRWTPERMMQIVGTWFARSGPQDPLADAIHDRFIAPFPLHALNVTSSPGVARALVPILAHHWHTPALQAQVYTLSVRCVQHMTTPDAILWFSFLRPHVSVERLLPFSQAITQRSLSEPQAREVLGLLEQALKPRPELFVEAAWVGQILNVIEAATNPQALWIGHALSHHAPGGCMGVVHEAYKSLGWTHPARNDLKDAANAIRERVGHVGGLSVAAEPEQVGALSEVHAHQGSLSVKD